MGQAPESLDRRLNVVTAILESFLLGTLFASPLKADLDYLQVLCLSFAWGLQDGGRVPLALPAPLHACDWPGCGLCARHCIPQSWRRVERASPQVSRHLPLALGC